MSITKTTVRKFVEAVENKALRSISERCSEQVNIEQNRILTDSGAYEKLKLMQSKLSQIDKIYDELCNICQSSNEIRYNKNSYYSLGKKINIDFVHSFKDNAVLDSKKIVELKKDFELKREAVEKEYAKVLASINRMSSVNKMIKYLKDIGFDTTSIEKEQTAITTNIDTTYLFVCGENK